MTCNYFLPTLVYHNTRLTLKVNNFSLLLSPPGYHHLIMGLEHNLTGDVLCIMGPEDLKEMGIATVGQRLAILKAVYLIKLDHDVPFEHGHYIPPCESVFSPLCH